MASRSFSRAQFRKTLSSKTMTSDQSSTFNPLSSELRCYKHSARVARKEDRTSIESSEFEAGVWRQAFDAMGELKKLRMKEFTPFTTLNKAPYHCLSLSRHYDVSYGKISQVEGGSVKGMAKPKEVKTAHCECIEALALPSLNEPLTTKNIMYNSMYHKERGHRIYIPKSCVMVWWNCQKYTAETICEWLQSFGPFLFTIYIGNTKLLVCYDNMKSAYRAVNCPLIHSGIHMTWHDVRLNNYGYFRNFEDYSLITDALWGKYFGRRKRGPPVFERHGSQEKRDVRKKSVTF